MISSNALSLFLLDHEQNGVFNHNIHSIQDLMCSDKPTSVKFKVMCADFLNLTLLTESTTPDNIQVVYGHASVGNNPLGETITAFALAGSLESPTVVSINAESALYIANKKILLPVTEVLLSAAISVLMYSKNLRGWASLNSVLLPPFLTKAVTLEVDMAAGELLKTFAINIAKHRLDSAADESEETRAGKLDG